MKLQKKPLLVASVAILILLAIGASVWFFVLRKDELTEPEKQAQIQTYNEQKSFEKIDADITAGKCNQITGQLEDLAASKNPLEKALAQLRLGECQILAAEYQAAVSTLQESVKALEELRYVSQLDRAKSQLERAKQEVQIQEDMNRELKPNNQREQGPLL